MPLISGSMIPAFPGVPDPSIYWGEGTGAASGVAEWASFKHNMHATGCPPNPPSQWAATDGLRPYQICPPWTMASTVGAPAVSGGVLTIDTSASAAQALNFTHDSRVTRLAYPIEVEFRARYVSGTTTNTSYTHTQFLVSTGLGIANLFLADDEVFLWNDLVGGFGVKGDPAFLDTTSDLHTYQMTIQANGDIDVYYDGGGTPVISGSVLPFPITGTSIHWGDATHLGPGVTEWAYITHNMLASPDADSDGTVDVCDRDDGLIHLRFQFKAIPAWFRELGFDSWNIYKGDLDELRASSTYTQLPGQNPLADQDCGLSNTSWEDLTPPAPGTAAFFLASGELANVEAGLGTDSEGVDRPNDNPCP